MNATSHTELQGPRVAFDAAGSIYSAFERQARRTPGRVALAFRESEVTYAELEARASAVAARLAPLCGEGEAVAAICAPRSPALIAGMLGVLKAGAAYLPLDSAFPPDRLDHMLADSRASALVTEVDMAARFNAPPPVVLIHGAEAEQGSPVSSNQRADARPAPGGARAAYLMYTSGSTGRPKGVVVEHRQALNFFAAMDALLGTEPGVWLAVTSVSFDISVLELFWTLSRGFTVVLEPDGELFAPASRYRAAAQLLRHRVTHLQTTPSMARLLAADGETLDALSGLRALLVGGEALPAALATRLRAAFPGRLFNMYGPTETTVWSTAHEITAVENAVPIGRPLANTELLILSADGAPASEGELWIGGEGVARGYHNRAALTAERFVQNPAGAQGRFYRTGDLVRVNPAGEVEFLGRADNQVKIMGHRIEPEEIEAALETHPQVRAAAVTAEEDAPGELRLIAYVFGDAPPAELRERLRATLPPHMLPTVFVPVTAMPYTPNGKVNRKALTALRAAPAAAPARSRQEIEARLYQLWDELLPEAPLAPDRNFFDMGATSLSMADAATELSNFLGRQVAITDMFEHPTIAALARSLAGGSEPAPAPPTRRQAFAYARRRTEA